MQLQRTKCVALRDKACDLHGCENFDVLPCKKASLFFGVAAEGVAPVDEIDGFADIGEQQRFLQCAVPTADNGGDAVFIKPAVAHGAVGNAVAEKLLLARQTEMAVLCACGEDHGAAFVDAVFRAHGEMLPGALHVYDLADVGLGIKREHLLKHLLGKLRAADGRNAGIVLHARRIGDLAAVALAFEKENALSAAAGVNGGGHSRRAASGNDDIVHGDVPPVKDHAAGGALLRPTIFCYNRISQTKPAEAGFVGSVCDRRFLIPPSVRSRREAS